MHGEPEDDSTKPTDGERIHRLELRVATLIARVEMLEAKALDPDPNAALHPVTCEPAG